MNDMSGNASYQYVARLVSQYKAMPPDLLAQLIASLDCLGTIEWSRCINALCGRYGTRLVLEQVISLQPDFLERYKPDRDIFPVCEGPIRRIGVLCHKGSGGGAERATMLWMGHMRRLGFHVVWLPDRDFEENEKFALDSNPVKRAEQLQGYISSERLDMVLLVDHWRMQVFRDLLYAKMAGTRVVIAEHNAYFFPLDDVNPMLYLMRLNLYPLADAVTVLSAENAAWWHSVGLRNVVQMPNFLTYGDDCMNKVPVAETKGRFLCVGRICNRKNQRDVVVAFARYLEKATIPNSSRLVLLGRFESVNDEVGIRKLIERLGIESKVKLPGDVLDSTPYYQDADVLLMASRLEGAPMVINEAKAHGLPTVMYELPYVEGTCELDGVMAVPMGDVQAMADTMYRCVADSAWYMNMSSAAISSLKRYAGEVLEARWRRLFDVLGKDRNRHDKLDSFCIEVSDQRMFHITMKAIGALVPALCVWQKSFNVTVEECNKANAERDRANAERDRANAERDKVWIDRDAAWKAHDRIEQERNEVWSRLDEERARQKVIVRERDEARQSLALAERRCAELSEELEKIRSGRMYKACHFLTSLWRRGGHD